VIALRGPPAPFPVPLSQWPLQKYLKWSTEITWQATKLITELFGDEPFLGVHLRNGLDWTRACALLEEDRHGLKNLMASSQCIGENPSEPVTKNMCFPTKQEVVRKISQILAEGKIKQVYIATDADPYLADFQEIFPRTNFVHLNPSLPQMDLYILGEAELFLGNCVSSFSSFVRRQRDVAGRETQYFGWQEPLSTMHKEL
jgi:peptide-O-fucosyltransferase